jgi:acetolactate synthase-1/2/3 large subunit
MYLNDALAAESRLVAVPCHHEQACGIAAEAYGRTGHAENPGFGVAMVTTGPGATNIFTPVIGAWIDSIPMLVISGQVKRSDRLGESRIRQAGVQEVEVVPMVRHFTKLATCIESPSQVDEVLEKSFAAMLTGRPGPVWIEIPLDVQGAPAIVAPCPRDVAGIVTASKQRDVVDESVDRLVGKLKSAKRPLILAGHGIRLSGAAHEFRRMVEAIGIPVVATWNAMDLLPHAHPLNAGRPGTVASRGANFSVQNCDFLLVLGCRLDNVVTAYNPSNFAPLAYKVVVDIDPFELARVREFTDEQICDDLAAVIARINSSFGDYQNRVIDWWGMCQSWKSKYVPEASVSVDEDHQITHYELVEVLSDQFPSNTLIATGSSGLAIEVFYTAFRNLDGQRIFLTSGLGSMGYGLPAAIGACLGNGSGPAFLVEGDGSFMLNVQELATLAKLNLPIRIVIIDNGGYASIRNTQKNYFNSRFVATGPGSGLNIPDLAEVAQAFGLVSRTVMSRQELRDSVGWLVSQTQPSVLVVKVRRDEALQPKVTAIPQSDGTIISMPLEDMSPLLPIDELRSNLLFAPATASLRARGLDN